MISVVILAAGAAARMGSPKQLLPFDHRPMLFWIAKAACDAALGPVIVVTGANHESVVTAVGDFPVRTIYNPVWADGQSTSVITGIQALDSETDAVIFVLADQPFITAALLQGMASAYHRIQATESDPSNNETNSDGTIVAPTHMLRRGTPVLFDLSRWKSALLELTGDQGARRIIRQNPETVLSFPVQDEWLLFDVDTPADYEAALAHWAEINRK